MKFTVKKQALSQIIIFKHSLYIKKFNVLNNLMEKNIRSQQTQKIKLHEYTLTTTKI